MTLHKNNFIYLLHLFIYLIYNNFICKRNKNTQMQIGHQQGGT